MKSTKPLVPDRKTKYTRQTAFNRAYSWAKRHGYSRGDGPGQANCVYRSPDGKNACLIGALVPDSCGLKPETMGSASDIWVLIGQLFSEECTPTFLSSLQRVHDDSAAFSLSKEHYLANLREFGESNSLTLPT